MPTTSGTNLPHDATGKPPDANDRRSESRHGPQLPRARELDERLLRMARRDFLTDLFNRYAFDERLELAMAQSSRFGHRIALLLIDLDDFKFVNDTHGHSVGDGLLKAIARRLCANVRKVDAIARLGGDEFSIIHTEPGPIDSIAEFARRLLEIIDQPFEVDRHQLHVTASIGIAVFPPEDSELQPQPLLRQADLALYKAKDAGGSTFRFHVQEMDRRVHERMALQADLSGALERDELFLRYQPQVRLRDGALLGAEVLLRWNHPQRGPVNPREFIPIAEASGQMVSIGRWVLSSAIRAARRLQRERERPFVLSVNLSPLQFRDPEFAPWLADTLATHSLPPAALELELKEEAVRRVQGSVEQALISLHSLGVRFSFDNFGKGLSALESLHRFPFARIKIDRNQVQRIEEEGMSTAMVAAIVALAGKLGLEVIAEGIETEEQAEALAREGCDIGQGFLFSTPLSSDELAEAVRVGGERAPALPGS